MFSPHSRYSDYCGSDNDGALVKSVFYAVESLYKHSRQEEARAPTAGDYLRGKSFFLWLLLFFRTHKLNSSSNIFFALELPLGSCRLITGAIRDDGRG